MALAVLSINFIVSFSAVASTVTTVQYDDLFGHGCTKGVTTLFSVWPVQTTCANGTTAGRRMDLKLAGNMEKCSHMTGQVA